MKALLLIAAVVAAITTPAPALGDTFITDTLAPGGGHSSPYDTQEGTTFITDTLGGNGHPYYRGAYVPGGSSQAVAHAIQSLGKQLAPTPAVVLAATGSGFSWSDAGVGAGAATGALVALLGATLLVTRRRERFAV